MVSLIGLLTDLFILYLIEEERQEIVRYGDLNSDYIKKLLGHHKHYISKAKQLFSISIFITTVS